MVLLVVLVVLSVFRVDMPHWLGSVAAAVATPFLGAQRFTEEALSDTQTALTPRRALEAELRVLEEREREMRAHEDVYEALQKENERLRTLLGRTSQHTVTHAAVLSHSAATLYDTMLIDVGSRDGVVSGQLVVAADSVALGAVTRVQSNTSVVTLFSAPNETTQLVLLHGTTTASVTAKGHGGGELRVEAPRELAMSEGDSALLPAFHPYVIADVRHIAFAPEDALQTLYLGVPVNVSSVRFVTVVDDVWQQETEQGTAYGT